MFILFGRWHFGRKAVAYRADWCTVCERRIVAQAIRSFDWFHVYLIPLIPLGHWRHWECPHCEKQPHLKGTGLLQAIIVALLFLPFFLTAILYWTMSTAGMDGDNVWMIRIFLTVMCLVMGYWAYAYQRDPSLKQRLAQIEPASETVCVNCGSALRPSKPPYCERCQMERVSLG
ncbi:MAG: hypothetical protein IPQ13_00795 [Holophagaceae bacterium]|nr:hypothetical protein [Holophagaceae bacterium]